MGLATLICELEQPCLHVSHAARGSRISGMVVQPGVKFSGEVLVHVAAPQDEDEDKDKEFPQFPIDSEQVLGIPVDQLWRWGLGDGRDFLPPKGSPEPEYHIFFHDLFARAGGDTNSDVVSVKVSEAFLRVSGHHVVLDNVWLWRADHDKAHAVIRRSVDGPPYYKNNVKNGLQVFGDHVSFYGLFVEHTLGDMVVWRGNFGRTYFYQCEFPYDLGPTDDDDPKMNKINDHPIVSYHVIPSNESRWGKQKLFQHDCRGLGVYSYFLESPVFPAAAIRVPDAVKTQDGGHNIIIVEGALTRNLGDSKGGIKSVINGRGKASYGKQNLWVSGDEHPAKWDPDASMKTVYGTRTDEIFG